MDCLEGLSRVQLAMDQFKESAETAGQMAKLAADGPERARAQYLAGLAMYEQYFALRDGRGPISKDPKRAAAALKQAEAASALGETDDPANERVRMLHGRVLAAMHRDDEAGKDFAVCSAAPGASAEECARAGHFAKDVALARDEPAPSFVAKTIDGKTVSLDSLAGKVVLIDFWATWCGVCARDSDYVQSTADVFGKDNFVLLEVSVDESDAKWRNWVREKRLQGVHLRDDSGAVRSQFHVAAYPTYVILDGNGTVRLRALGIEGDLKGTVRKLLAESKLASAGQSGAEGGRAEK
jgi:peroxiredoxin